jgi:hypothetical protein
MHRAVWSLAIATLFVQGCGDRGNLPLPSQPVASQRVGDPIAAFIESEGLPDPQPVQIVLDLPASDVTIFRLPYGHREDDLVYEVAYGLRHLGKIGWIFPGYVDPVSAGFTMYDPAASDAALFSVATWKAVDSADTWLYWQPFLMLLARDPDVPETALLQIAEQLADYIAPWIAGSLLDNPRVQSSREILSVLATLPVHDGDAYAEARLRAQALLDMLDPS